MGEAADLVKAPNGAMVNAEILKISPHIMCLERTAEEAIASGMVEPVKGSSTEIALSGCAHGPAAGISNPDLYDGMNHDNDLNIAGSPESNTALKRVDTLVKLYQGM